ncbi:MAG: putative bifunctional diguanylate cyclase/phosphodiesterase, partial [Wenzhouxiangella sp.]
MTPPSILVSRPTRQAASPPAKWRRLEVTALIGALVLIMGMAIGFTLFIVQLQSAATAYMAGNSHWSRAQIASVFALYRYVDSGDPAELAAARTLLEIPLGDRDARLAMEAPVLDREAAREGLLRGGNHPDDIDGMIWLFRNFSGLPKLRDAIGIWRESDQPILELVELANVLELAWAEGGLDQATRQQVLTRLQRANANNYQLSQHYIGAFTEATLLMRSILYVAAVVVMIILSLLAALAAWRLIRLISLSQRRFRAIFEQAGVGMAELSPDGQFNQVNSALCRILGHSRESLLTKRYQDVAHPEDTDIGFERGRDLLASTGQEITLEQRFIRDDGDVVWGRMTASVIEESRAVPQALIAVIEDISESHRLSIELSYQASHDSLTDLLNRRALERRLASALHAVRENKSLFALCFIDLDEFKVVNDTCGHAAGDQMLRQIAELLRAHTREGDVLARPGGDEFALLLEGCDLTTAGRVAEKLRRALEEFVFKWQDRTFNVSCSMGVVPVTPDSVDIGSVMRSADSACYLAKEKGRNRVHVSSDDDEQVARRRGEMEWLSRIRAALAEDRLYLDAQRIVSLQRSEPARYEVLVRLIDEDGENVLPGAFLPPAERYGTVHEIDRWVIRQVCRTLADSPGHLAELGACHINISGRSFDRREFQGFVLDTLKHYAIPPEKICFEITETAAMRNLGDAVRFMHVLGKHGCRFALDDFGAGLSSFGYLRRLPVEYLKIDGIFVRDIVEDQTDLAMVRAINEIGQT